MSYRTTEFRQNSNITDLHLQSLISGTDYHDHKKAAQYPKEKKQKSYIVRKFVQIYSKKRKFTTQDLEVIVKVFSEAV